MEQTVNVVVVSIVIILIIYWFHKRAERQQEINKETSLRDAEEETKRLAQEQEHLRHMAGLGYEQQVYLASEETAEENDDFGPVSTKKVVRRTLWKKIGTGSSPNEPSEIPTAWKL